MPSALIASLRSRGLQLYVSPSGKVKVTPSSLLTKEERALLRAQSAAVIALLTMEQLLARDAEDQEREQLALVEAAERRSAAARHRYQKDVMATWDESKVRRLCEAGKLTGEDVALWHEAQQELQHRADLRTAATLLAGLTGRTVRIE